MGEKILQSKKRANRSRPLINALAGAMIITGLCLALFPFLQSFYKEKVTWGSQEAILIDQPENGPGQSNPGDEAISGPARLLIPKLGLDLAVGYGISEQALKENPGLYPQSGSPATGNVSIAGHRNAYGSPFFDLDKMLPGDEIFLTYHQKTYHYLVETVFETHSRDWSVIEPTPRAALTLTTCTPLHPADGQYNRLVVRAYLKDIQ
ncbi:MAG: class E sortase [Syntrophomonas sp.]